MEGAARFENPMSWRWRAPVAVGVFAVFAMGAEGCGSTADRIVGADQAERMAANEQAYEALIEGSPVDYEEVYAGSVMSLGTTSEVVEKQASEQDMSPEKWLKNHIFEGIHPPNRNDNTPRLRSFSMCVAADVASSLEAEDVTSLRVLEQEYQAFSGKRGMQEEQSEVIYRFCEEDLLQYLKEHDDPTRFIQPPEGGWIFGHNPPGNG